MVADAHLLGLLLISCLLLALLLLLSGLLLVLLLLSLLSLLVRLSLGCICRSLLLVGGIVVDLVVSLVLLNLLQILELLLPYSAEGRSRVLNNSRPGRARTQELDTSGLGGQGVLAIGSGSNASNATKATDASDAGATVVTEDVLSDDSLGLED